MIVMPEIDLTPETAHALDRFRHLFWTGRFLWAAGFGEEALGTTDIRVLYRTMDRLVLTASGQQLCSFNCAPTPQEALAQAQASVTELKARFEQLREKALEWYWAQSATTQAAVLELLISLKAWLDSILEGASPEAVAVLEAVKALIDVLIDDTSGGRNT